jgi:outer membrane lipoprotein-sorting protein
MKNPAGPDKKNLINRKKKIPATDFGRNARQRNPLLLIKMQPCKFRVLHKTSATAMRLLLHFILPMLTLATGVAENAVLDAWLKRQSSITSLDSEFIQERRLPALKHPVSTSGRLCFSKPDKIRWQLGNPFETLAIADGKTLTLIEAATKSARQTDVNSPQAARFSLLSGKAFQSPEIFYQTFELIESRVSSGIHQYTLKAKDRRIRAQIPWIFLDIDPAKNELRALELELQDQSRLRTVFQNPRFNGKLDDALFHPDLGGYTVK